MSAVIVFGSINVDYVASVENLPGPGETVKTPAYQALPGGKGANQALSARRNGAVTYMVGAVGSDGQDDVSLKHLRSDGVDLSGVQTVEGPSGLAMIAVEKSGENQIIVVSGANDLATAASIEGLASGNILVTQNEVPWPETAAAHRAAKAAGVTVVHNAAPAHTIDQAALENIDVLVVNEHELELAAASKGSEDQQALDLLKRGVGAVVLTLGALGAAIYQDDEKDHVAAVPTTVVDTTGAGDAFVGALAAALGAGTSLREAVRSANTYAAKVCGVLGAQTPVA